MISGLTRTQRKRGVGEKIEKNKKGNLGIKKRINEKKQERKKEKEIEQ